MYLLEGFYLLESPEHMYFTQCIHFVILSFRGKNGAFSFLNSRRCTGVFCWFLRFLYDLFVFLYLLIFCCITCCQLLNKFGFSIVNFYFVKKTNEKEESTFVTTFLSFV